MKRLICLTIALLPLCLFVHSQSPADSVDVVDYDISLDLSSGTSFTGDATITLALTRQCDEINLQLLAVVDSLWVDEQRLTTTDLSHIPTAHIAVGDLFSIRVCYHGTGYVESRGWGGFHFDDNMTYNLGVGFVTDPHPLGRAVFPCRDNFTDKATYTLHITARETWSAECSGVLQSRSYDSTLREHTVWRIDQPVCTYTVGISQAPFSRIEDTVGGYPLTIGYTTSQDSAMVRRVFELLDTVVPMFEQCFGPYRWHRIGYIPTAIGSMEHVNNIALAYNAMESVNTLGQSTIAHELAHAWFGNLITCSDEGDMWINEGGASFASEVACEATLGRAASIKEYQKSLEVVLRTAHIADGDYLPLHGMPHNHTYGNTTYDKGALVWHSLRGYLGDSLFYSSMRTLFDRCAFGTIDAYQLRDSLSLYSNTDLTAFFDRHVFSPGFVDYNVSMSTEGCPSLTADVTIRQQGVGTDILMHNNRVPITVMGWNGEQHKEQICFVGTDTTIRIAIPFPPAFCVLDADCEQSDAATVDNLKVSYKGIFPSPQCHLTLNAQSDVEPTDYYIEHHWGKPFDADTLTGVIRTANRYWVVNSTTYRNDDIQCNFHFVRGGYRESAYANLDNGFIRNTHSVDSLGILWRLNADSPWLLLAHPRPSNRNDGYLALNHLRTGEYTLAVVDTNMLGFSDATPLPNDALDLFPNPITSGQPITICAPCNDPYDVSILDATGHTILHTPNCTNSDRIALPLEAGIYLVRIENNYISLQSKLIVI